MNVSLRPVMLLQALLLLAAEPALAQGVLVDKSEIRFVASQLGVNVAGSFRKWKANIVFLPGALARSKADFDIDLTSIDLASDDSESEVKGQVWFDAAKFPVAHFASTSISHKGGDKYEVVGRLSLKGATRDAIVPISVRRDATGNTIAEGSFVVKRLAYKVGEGLLADTDMVADDVIVRVRMVLLPAK